MASESPGSRLALMPLRIIFLFGGGIWRMHSMPSPPFGLGSLSRSRLRGEDCSSALTRR
jgi:hypothetical protein